MTARQRLILASATCWPSLAPRVIPKASRETCFEHGGPEYLDASENYALIAHFSESPMVSRSLRTLVTHLAAAGYLPIIVSSSTSTMPLNWGGHLPPHAVVLRKPNVGHDFGSWATGFALLPGLWRAERLILANDSVLGPFAPLSPYLRQFEASDADVWGLTDSTQYTPHLQSYFLGFRAGVLARPFLRDFWAGIRHERSKRQIVYRHEIGLSRLVRRNDCTLGAAFPASSFVPAGQNPVIRGWDRLLENGYPFVKRALAHPACPERKRVNATVLRRFHTHLDEWI